MNLAPYIQLFAPLPAFALTLFRIGGMFLAAPFFGGSGIPVRIRGGMVVLLAAIMTPLVIAQTSKSLDFSSVISGGLCEALLGLVIGLVFGITLMCAEVAGALAAQQAGLSLSEVINPLQDSQTSVLGQSYMTIFGLCFLAVGGHRAMIAALLDSYRAIPVLTFAVNDSILLLLVDAVTGAFNFGIRLAGPVLVALFLTETALGFVSRTVPQLNILSVGFAIRGLIALGVIAVSVTTSEGLLLKAFDEGIGLLRAGLHLPDSRWGSLSNAG
ncbi:MAG: flagellar biosynthetic protein FliR [Planctomycetes bacterium]|nr:flagellar biosynthetic protein FliR [Planctomycetota bacterium]MBI3835289.1 flagellar biosynthetic protein FliR [Planctomycetota bacterium]